MLKKVADTLLSFLPHNYGIRVRGLIPDWIVYNRAYLKYAEVLNRSQNWSLEQKKEYIFKKTIEVVNHAYKNVSFYREFYSERNFHPESLRNFDDIKKIPIIKKADLKKIPIQNRSCNRIKSIKGSSGGTSGQPLKFFLDKKTFSAREKAHMNLIWESIGYSRNSFRLHFHGRKLGNQLLVYSPFSSEVALNIYADKDKIASNLIQHPCFEKIEFIHGYPGLIYEFTRQWETSHPLLIDKLSQQVKGLLLSSEYPQPVHRKYLENIYDAKSISWYGHSEMAALAYERMNTYVYEPFVSYGYSEAVKYVDGTHLVSTAWDNFSHPFIRYDTEDLIDPKLKDDYMLSFKISEGRNSEYIIDKNGHKVFLTGLIFGQHHEIIKKSDNISNLIDFIQIGQEQKGNATIYFSIKNDEYFPNLNTIFNFHNINIDFKFEKRKKPFKTANGKIPLLVTKKLKQLQKD